MSAIRNGQHEICCFAECLSASQGKLFSMECDAVMKCEVLSAAGIETFWE